MIIKAFNARRYIKYLIILLVIIGIAVGIGLFKPGAVKVWSSKREIPIYSVECSEKKAAITFDCAWGALS